MLDRGFLMGSKRVKSVVKWILGKRLSAVASTGMRTLRNYPRYLGGGVAGPLQDIVIEITFRCNARCRMCPLYGEQTNDPSSRLEASGRKELTADAIRNVLRQCATLGVQRVTFTGGEPLLRTELPDLVEFGSGLGMNITVITNGSLLSENVARNLVAAGLNTLLISLDGPEEVHNSIRRFPNLFVRMDRGVSMLRAEQIRQKRTTPSLFACCTVSTLNQGRLRELVPIAASWKATLSLSPIFFVLQRHDQFSAPASSPKFEDWLLPDHIRKIDPALLSRELRLADQLSRTYGVPLNLAMPTSPHGLRERYHSPSYSENNKCLYAWHTTRMNPYGDVYPCSLQVIMGNVLEVPLQEIWNSQRYIAFRRLLRKRGRFAQCARCCALNRHDWVARVLPRFSWLLRSAPPISGMDQI